MAGRFIFDLFFIQRLGEIDEPSGLGNYSRASTPQRIPPHMMLGIWQHRIWGICF
jgi:hypothetical protein